MLGGNNVVSFNIITVQLNKLSTYLFAGTREGDSCLFLSISKYSNLEYEKDAKNLLYTSRHCRTRKICAFLLDCPKIQIDIIKKVIHYKVKMDHLIHTVNCNPLIFTLSFGTTCRLFTSFSTVWEEKMNHTFAGY